MWARFKNVKVNKKLTQVSIKDIFAKKRRIESISINSSITTGDPPSKDEFNPAAISEVIQKTKSSSDSAIIASALPKDIHNSVFVSQTNLKFFISEKTVWQRKGK